jgi:RimJ/RimL family protein N-acetyltransferase
MTDISIADYDVLMAEKIRHLFSDIYPNHPDVADKMCYDPTRQDHVATKVAYLGDDIVGQANIFLHKAIGGNANLGFHVHSSMRERGIATYLSNEVIKVARTKGIRVFYIRTHEDNFAAIAVASKLGFTRDDSRFADKGIALLKK